MLRYANPGWIHYGLIIEFCKGYLHASPAQRLLNPPTPFSVHFLHHASSVHLVVHREFLQVIWVTFTRPFLVWIASRPRAKKARIQYLANAEINFEGLSCLQSPLPPCHPVEYRSSHTPSLQSLWNNVLVLTKIEWFLGTFWEYIQLMCNKVSSCWQLNKQIIYWMVNVWANVLPASAFPFPQKCSYQAAHTLHSILTFLSQLNQRGNLFCSTVYIQSINKTHYDLPPPHPNMLPKPLPSCPFSRWWCSSMGGWADAITQCRGSPHCTLG